jgi:hypothetical protein
MSTRLLLTVFARWGSVLAFAVLAAIFAAENQPVDLLTSIGAAALTWVLLGRAEATIRANDSAPE